jgi:hypothetical protein
MIASVPGNLAKSNLAHGSRTVMFERSSFQPAWPGRGASQCGIVSCGRSDPPTSSSERRHSGNLERMLLRRRFVGSHLANQIPPTSGSTGQHPPAANDIREEGVQLVEAICLSGQSGQMLSTADYSSRDLHSTPFCVWRPTC